MGKTKPSLEVHVECYAGYRSEETPRRLLVGERRVEVVDVLDCWLSPEHRYFRLRGGDGCVYVLRHDVDRGLWELPLWDSGHREGTRLSFT